VPSDGVPSRRTRLFISPRRYRWGVAVFLLAVLGLALMIGLRYVDYYYSKGLPGHEEGHRRPFLLGLWQPGPRDRQSVKARFLENIKKAGPNWGQPDWTLQGGDTSLGPHSYYVVVPYSLGKDTYSVEAVALDTDKNRSIDFEIKTGDGSFWVSGMSQSRGRIELAAHGRVSSERWRVSQILAAEIDSALRDALE
jgi:hypothetical protein